MEFRKSHIMGLPLIIAGVRKNRCRPFSRRVCRHDLATEGVDLLVIGNTDSKCFPEELKKYTNRTAINGGGIRLNFLVNYGWKWDLSNIKSAGFLHSSDISRIDMVIRWGGMRRLSGFLPVQSVYADFYVEEKLWPDYEKSDFYRAMDWYKKQDVTYGG